MTPPMEHILTQTLGGQIRLHILKTGGLKTPQHHESQPDLLDQGHFVAVAMFLSNPSRPGAGSRSTRRGGTSIVPKHAKLSTSSVVCEKTSNIFGRNHPESGKESQESSGNALFRFRQLDDLSSSTRHKSSTRQFTGDVVSAYTEQTAPRKTSVSI